MNPRGRLRRRPGSGHLMYSTSLSLSLSLSFTACPTLSHACPAFSHGLSDPFSFTACPTLNVLKNTGFGRRNYRVVCPLFSRLRRCRIACKKRCRIACNYAWTVEKRCTRMRGSLHYLLPLSKMEHSCGRYQVRETRKSPKGSTLVAEEHAICSKMSKNWHFCP